MSVADAPDWYNAGGANPFSAQAVLLENANPSAGLPISVQIPTNSSPFHTLGLWCPTVVEAEHPRLFVVGDQSGIIFYGNYILDDVNRFSGPVVVPVTTLFDTSFSFIPSVNGVLGLYAWLYLESVPPVSRPYGSQLLVASDAITGGSTRGLLFPDGTCTAFVLDSITYTIGSAVAQSCAFESAPANVYSAFASPGFGSFTDRFDGLVVLSNQTYSVVSTGAAVANSHVVLRYWRSFTTDGLDIL